MKAYRTLHSNFFLTGLALLLGVFFCQVAMGQQIENHGGGILKSVVGTNTLVGTSLARTGDFVTATITVQNIDSVTDLQFGVRRADSLRIDMVIDLVMHGMHTEASSNLLDGPVTVGRMIYDPNDATFFLPPIGTNVSVVNAPHSVTLTNLGDYLTVTHTYRVLPGEDDPANLVNGFLTDLAVAMGADLRNCTNCPSLPGVPDDFLLQFPGGILVTNPVVVPPRGVIGDFVWEDVDRDGRQDAGEVGIAGMVVTLQDCAGNPLTAVVTDQNGKYLFTNLVAGSYRVFFGPPANYVFSPQNVGSDNLDSDADANGFTACFALAAGETNLTVDAGLFQPPAAVGDFVWDDRDLDGQQDAGEPGIAGVSVLLQDCTGAARGATVTGPDGQYLFTGLAAGNYRVKFNAPANYRFTVANIGSDALDSDADTNGFTQCFALAAGETNLTIDAGLFVPPPTPGAIGDFVWDDRDRDGRQDVGEPGIGGVLVTLQSCAGATLGTTVTAGDGKYLFSGLAAGSYRVLFGRPANFFFTQINVGSDDADSDADTNGLTACITLAAGQTNLTVDAGLQGVVPLGAIGDFVWNDVNRDGCQDLGELGIPGVRVTLQTCTGTALANTTTDANGKYLFEGLTGGTYRVVFTKPNSSYTFTQPAVAACGDDLDSDADVATGITPCLTLAPGERNFDIDAGLFVPECGAIGDFVWEDRNCNGLQDAGEPGINNVQVYLTDCAGNIMSVGFTDANGRYLFPSLPAGDYRVVFFPPANTVFTLRNAGSAARDSNADANGLTECITLAACETNLTIDAGLCPPPGECCVRDVTEAVSDPEFNPGGSDHAIWIPGISTNLIFYPEPGKFRECPDGTATLTGRVASRTNLNAGFDVNIVFSGRRTNAPSGSPKKDLDEDAYEDEDGPVDTDTWYYYTVFNGTLTGFGLYDGAVLTLTRSGPAFQIGAGANNKNVNFGASGWFDWTREVGPNVGRFPGSGKGDINVDFGPCIPEAAPQPVARAVLGSLVQTPSGEKRLTVSGPTDHYYLVECSADLTEWKPIVIVRNTNGVLTFKDHAMEGSRCFYRVKMVR